MHKPYHVGVAKRAGGYFQSWQAYNSFNNPNNARNLAKLAREHPHAHKEMCIAMVYVCEHGQINWHKSDMLPRFNVRGACEHCGF